MCNDITGKNPNFDVILLHFFDRTVDGFVRLRFDMPIDENSVTLNLEKKKDSCGKHLNI